MKQSSFDVVRGFAGALCLLLPLAAQALSISVSPARILAGGPPGVSGEAEISVSNNSGATLTFEIEARDFGVENNSKEVILPPGSTPNSAASWLTFHPTELTLAPKSTGKFKAIISVPADARGGHYAILMVRTVVPREAKDGLGVNVGAQMAIKLYHAVTGRSSPRLVLLDKTVRPPTPHEQMEVKLQLANAGDAHTRLLGDMAILDGQKKLIGRSQLDGSEIILPGQQRNIEFSWGGELKRGSYTVVITISGSEGVEPLVVEFPVSTGGATQGARKGA